MVAKWEKALKAMRNNPRDWTIQDAQTVAKPFNITVASPTRGSHFKVSHPNLETMLTIPAKQPIKPIYIRQFLNIIDSIK